MRRRVLLDENVPNKLKLKLEADKHHIKLVQEVGWRGVSNGTLLNLIEHSQAWDVFIANDQSIPSQQNRKFLRTLSYGIIIVEAESNDLEDYLPFVPKLRYLINKVGAGDLFILKLEKTR